MFRRAAHEPRIAAALVLLVAAAAVGLHAKRSSQSRANRDYAICSRDAAGCVTKELPVAVAESRSLGTGGYSDTWSVTVQTGAHSSLSIGGLTRAAAAPFENRDLAEARYHDGRLSAIVAMDGTSLKVPFAFTTELFVLGGIAVALFLAAGGFLAWGFTRVNRSTSAPQPRSG
jgi:hypothetical protein